MLNNPPELQPAGLLPSAVAPTQSPDQYKYPYVGDEDYKGSKYHRWLVPYEIGVVSYNGSNAISVTPGLANGQSMTINSDQVPDRWIISVVAEQSGGGSSNQGVRGVRVTLGPGPGGPSYILSTTGKLKLPAQGMNYITITNVSVAADTIYGTVIAVGGFDLADIDIG